MPFSVKSALSTRALGVVLAIGALFTGAAVSSSAVVPEAVGAGSVASARAEYPGKIVVTSADVWTKVKEMSATHPTFVLYSSPAWCVPCQQAEPMLNKVAEDGKGKFTMATVTDEQVEFAGGSTPSGFQGWPSVYVIKDGQFNIDSMTHPLNGEQAHLAWIKEWLGVGV